MAGFRLIARAGAIFLALCSACSAEGGISGLWMRDTGTARVQFAPCGDKICGTITWVRDADSATKVGMRVFYDMEPERANNWTGTAFNPEDKQTYTGTLTLSGNTITATGCVIGRLFCRSVRWNRAK